MTTIKELAMRSLGLVLPSLLGTMICQTAAFANQQGWALEQISDLSGRQTVTWTNSAFRITFKKEDMVFITKAPDWKVLIYSPVSHKYCESTRAKFADNFTDKSASKRSSRSIIKGKKTQFIAGLPTSEWGLANKSKEGTVDRQDSSELWITKSVSMPPKVKSLVEDLVGIPQQAGIPLRIIRTRNNGVTVTTIDTLAYHKVSLPDDYFKLPPGMKRVKDEISILVEKDSEDFLAAEADFLAKEASVHGHPSSVTNQHK